MGGMNVGSGKGSGCKRQNVLLVGRRMERRYGFFYSNNCCPCYTWRISERFCKKLWGAGCLRGGPVVSEVGEGDFTSIIWTDS